MPDRPTGLSGFFYAETLAFFDDSVIVDLNKRTLRKE